MSGARLRLRLDARVAQALELGDARVGGGGAAAADGLGEGGARLRGGERRTARTALGWRSTCCGVRTSITVTPISSSSSGPISARPCSSLSLMNVPFVELEVLDDRAVRGRLDAGVAARRLGVLDHEVGGVVATDDERPRGRSNWGARSGSLHDFEHQRQGGPTITEPPVRVKCPRADRRPGSWRRGPSRATACCRSARCRRAHEGRPSVTLVVDLGAVGRAQILDRDARPIRARA